MNKDELTRKKYHRDWRRGNRDAVLAARRKYYAKLKQEVFTAYGGKCPKCVCCGEDNSLFLTIDHTNGDGKLHRRTINKHIYSWLRKQKYPSGFQVLCFNCNCGRSVNKGICPHAALDAVLEELKKDAMIPKEAIEKAKEGGWKPAKWVEELGIYIANHDAPWQETALDPSFWQALGKALGWGEGTSVSEAEWLANAVGFTQRILTGGDTKKFWSDLLTNPR